MSSGSEKQQLFFPEGNRKRLPGGICTGCIAFRAQDRRPICRALRLQQKDRVPGIRDDAQDAEGRAASAKLQRRLRHSQYCRAVPAGRELQPSFVSRKKFLQPVSRAALTDAGASSSACTGCSAPVWPFSMTHTRAQLRQHSPRSWLTQRIGPSNAPSSSPSSSSHLR